MTIAVARAVTQ